MSFLAFGAGFVNALNNRKREERAEEATIRKENRAFETAKKKYAFQNLYNQQISLNKQLNDFIVKVQNGQIKDEDGVPLTMDSPSVKKSIRFYQTNIDNVNKLINGETPSDIVTTEQGTDKEPPKSLRPKTEEDIIYEAGERGVSIPKQSFNIGMGITPFSRTVITPKNIPKVDPGARFSPSSKDDKKDERDIDPASRFSPESADYYIK